MNERPPFWKRAGALLATCALALTGCSATTAADTSAEPGGQLFDESLVHTIDVEFDTEDYDAMIATYQETGDKEWISATVTIDGETFENVGLKLKGNSSLQGLAGRQEQDGGAPDGKGPGAMGGASAEEPEALPWRIRLDKFVDGQSYEGTSDMVVRSNTSQTSLNEAVALALLDEAGMATQQAASTRFSVNGSDQTLRLVLEMPEQDWYEDNFSGEGTLYKAEAEGSYDYRGDDPAAYTDVFDLEATTSAVEDYTPLIEFLEFVNESDDETFAAELADHLDVEEFARYLAIQDLIANDDDIDGPGNNSYLAYDAETETMTVVAWDHNLAFGGLGGGMGEMTRGDGEAPEGFEPPGDGEAPQPPADGEAPEGFEPPADGEAPEGFEPPTDGEAPGGFEPPTDGEAPEPPTGGQAPGGGDRPAGGAMGSNVLAERFREVTEFADLIEQATADLTADLYESGYAQDVLDTWAEVLLTQAEDLVEEQAVAEDVARIESVIDAAQIG